MFLKNLEERYGPIYKHFNLICGTSTGGIIALALAAGIPANQIVEFYTQSGPEIFNYHKSWLRKIHWLKQLIFKSKYSNKVLHSALINVFGNMKVEDCKTHVLIPSVNITTGIPCIFKSDHVPELKRDSKRLITEIALATSAAPSFFPIVDMETQNGLEQFVDGGLVANNPGLLGIQEYLKHYHKKDGRFSNYNLMSISSLNDGIKFPQHINNRRLPFRSWGENLISLMIDSQSVSIHYHIEHLRSYTGGGYVRIPSVPLTKEEKKHIALDLASPKALSILKEKGLQVSRDWVDKEEVACFFSTNIKEVSV